MTMGDICAEMPMDGCDECTSGHGCDLLTVYSNLCLAMPVILLSFFLSFVRSLFCYCTFIIIIIVVGDVGDV